MFDALQRFNPWWRGQPSRRLQGDLNLIEREVFSHLVRVSLHREDPLPVFVLGPRQVGKTTLVHQVLQQALTEEKWPPENIVYADMEDAAFQGAGIRGVFEACKSQLRSDAPVLFVLDEVHYAEDWAQQLKVLADERRARFLITGSASAKLLHGMREKLPGRLLTVPLLGFSFDEFMRCWGKGRSPFGDQSTSVVSRQPRREVLEEYLAKGGFPRWVDTERTEAVRLVREQCQRAITEDIIARLGRRDGRRVREMFLYLMEHAGGLLNKTSLSANLGLGAQHAQVDAGITALEEAGLIHLLESSQDKNPLPARGRGRQPKVYPTDPGMARAFGPLKDDGKMVECAVFRHLLEWKWRMERHSGEEVHLLRWRNDRKEVDFVLTVGERSILVEVKAASKIHEAKAHAVEKKAGGYRFQRLILACQEFEPRRAGQVEILPLEELFEECSCADPMGMFQPFDRMEDDPA